MKINDAISQRILQYCDERNLSINKLASLSMLTQSTLNNIVNNYVRDVKLLTIIKVCSGLDISLSEFFDCDLFNNIDFDF